jgi:hypothetical protein
MGGQEVERVAERDASMQYDPAIRASEQRSLDIPAWFEEFRAKQEALRRSTVGAYDMQAANTRSAAASGQAMDVAQTGDLMAKMQADAAKRGAAVDPTVQSTADQASASRRAALERFAAQAGTQAANATADYNTRIGIADRDSIEKRLGESKRRGAIQKERGQFKGKRIGELREGERKYALERQAFGLDVKKAENDAAADAAQLAISQQNADTSAASLEERRRHNQVVENEPSGGSGGGLTRDDKQSWAKSSNKTLGKLASATKNGVIRRKDGSAVARINAKNEAKIAEFVRGMVGDELLGKAIAQQLVWGGVGPGTEKALRKKFRMPIKSLGLKRSSKLK